MPSNGTAGSMDLHFTGDRAQYEADTSDLTIRSGNIGIGTEVPGTALEVLEVVMLPMLNRWSNQCSRKDSLMKQATPSF